MTPTENPRRVELRRATLWMFSEEELVDELLERGYDQVKCSVLVKTEAVEGTRGVRPLRRPR